MSRVVVAQANHSGEGVVQVLDDFGLPLVDRIKAAKSIVIAAGENITAAQAVMDFVQFHSRTPVHVLRTDDRDLVEGSIPRADDVRMPIRRQRIAMESDFIISIASMIPDRSQRTSLSIEQWVFQSWIVPPRASSRGTVITHDPWLEGELRDAVIADVYAQKPCQLAIVDGTTTIGSVLAGFDAVAVDSIAVHIAGVDPDQVGYLNVLASKGIGVATLSKIDVPLGVITAR